MALEREFYFMSMTDPQIQIALALKVVLFQLQTSYKVNQELMSDVFNQVLWQKRQPTTLSQAIDEIINLDNQQLIDAFIQLQEEPQLTPYINAGATL